MSFSLSATAVRSATPDTTFREPLNSSGSTIRRGRITKTGNVNVRWMLIESAWSYRLKARKSAHLLKRQVDADEKVQELSWKAQVRLCGRYQRLLQRGKPKGKVITCIARELAGFDVVCQNRRAYSRGLVIVFSIL
ncbi:MAG: transposase [Desulfovibrio sp.]|nr:transposase [Desulfovibrio sp.]